MSIIEKHQGCPGPGKAGCWGPIGKYYTVFGSELGFLIGHIIISIIVGLALFGTLFLLKKKEIQYLIGKSRQSGLTLIPLKVYTNDGKIKLEFGIAKGKKQFDKREKIKKRELDKEIQRELKRG